MRVAYLNADCGIPVFGGKGACVHIQEMIRAMESIGAEVRVVATRMGDARPVDFDTPVIHATRSGNAVSADTRQAKEERNIADARAASDTLVAVADSWAPDMIYERYSLWSVAGVTAARKLGIPLVLEVNAPLVLEQEAHRELALAEIAARIERECFTHAEAIVTVSRDLRDYVISRGARPERVTVTGNAVDTARFNPNAAPERFGIPESAFVIGFTGSLKNWHGIEPMMEAFRLVRQEAPNARMVVVGDGPMRGWINGFARGGRLEDAITLTGWLSHEQLPNAIAGMDVALAPYPALDDFYFSPLKLYEYLGVGRPVVASAIGQIAEIVEDRISGLLVPPGDPVRLARAILAIRADQRLAGQLASGAAAEGAKHTWRRNAETVLSLGARVRKAA